jgi:hypothetical protein
VDTILAILQVFEVGEAENHIALVVHDITPSIS